MISKTIPVEHTLVLALLPTRRPCLEQEPTDEPLSEDRRQVEARILDMYRSHPAVAFLAIGCIPGTFRLSPSIEWWRTIASAFVHDLLVDPQTEVLRERQQIAFPAEAALEWIRSVPAMVGVERVDEALIAAFWDMLHQAYIEVVRKQSEPVEILLKRLSPGEGLDVHRVHFHLVENRKDEAAPFAFLATYATQLDSGSGLRHLPLKHALQEFGQDSRKLVSLLASVKKAAAASDLIRSILDSGEIFHPLRFTPKEACQFLRETPLYEQAGILCRIPRWWKAAPRHVSLALAIGDSTTGARLGAQALLTCRPFLHIDGEEISAEEARDILSRYEGLALIKGKWTVVDREALERNLELYEQAQRMSRKMHIPFAEAMRVLMGLQTVKPDGKTAWVADVQPGAWMREVLEKLRSPASLQPVAQPKGLQAALRPYQQAGLSWLSFLYELGFGACLADDMGLGKTLQILALILSAKERGKKPLEPSLLVVPASLIDNWLSEIRRFAPDLDALVLHPQYLPIATAQTLLSDQRRDLAITTYAMARKLSWLKERTWHFLILDEAQAIKNPASSQSRSVKEIPAVQRIALTGTPVENRIGDIWSIFDFLNRGLLGSAQGFQKFAKSLAERPEGYARMRRVIQPYILRRMKTDPAVISDLPDKIDMKSWAILSKKQRILYQKMVNDLAKALEATEGIQRKGLILSFLTKFKQVCNHPDQVVGGGRFAEEDSGKLQRLRELCESIFEKRERVLVFTQFREMVDPLDAFLKSVFGRPGVQLHGGTAVGKRKEAIAAFQNPDDYVPYFVLSLKAGGVGLNLTAANHVIHFDRWWNPAVEKQAEDRAFRIGQKRNVIVHKFICKGTVEEKIDELIEGKIELANQLLSTTGAENWITELSNERIREMFTLTLTGD